MDEATIRKVLGKDPDLAQEVPPVAAIENLHKIELEEEIRLSSEYPGLFKRHKGQGLHGATISYRDVVTGFWRHRIVILASNGKILLVT
jgi:hypothetical protein